jgi:protein tyrosine phosphatase (PTP) superfamily phosphohydrolase (DUF442 family)
MRRLLFLTLVTGSVLIYSGCQTCCRQPVATRTTVVPGSACPPSGGVLLPAPPAPLGGPPPGSVVIPPPPSPVGPPPGAQNLGAPPSISRPPGSASQAAPRFEANWLPADARSGPAPAKIVPAPVDDPLLGSSGATPSQSAPKLYPPEVSDKITGEPPLIDEKTQPAAPPAGLKKAKTAFPVGIPQFAKAPLDGVWVGLRPSIDDGLDWLAASEYRTVLHLRTPGEPENADRKQVEKLGMAYVSIEVSPQTLTREKLDAFAKLVGDAARKPLFVYDQDGSLAGPLWYLYFRKLSGDDDGPARIKADGLGLRADREGQHRLMWLAAQQYLQANQ